MEFRNEYISRVNRVIDYINTHLDQELSLTILAETAHFSSFYFHRIFKAITDETLNHYIMRARLARAQFLLAHNPTTTITDIAFQCGYSSPAVFARAFRASTHTTPAAWRRSIGDKSKICKELGNPCKARSNAVIYRDPASQFLAWRIEMINKQSIRVEVKQLPELTVAYVRHVGRYHQDVALFQRLFKKLLTWAAPRQLVNFPETQALTVYGGHPDTTDPEKLRVDVCLSVPSNTKVSDDIGCRRISGGQYAVVQMEAPLADCYQAWEIVFNEWLPESGLQPDDRDFYLNHRNDPETHPQKRHIVDMCIPVKPL